MSGETTITVVGNLVADPELKFTPNGQAVANFTIASTPRTYNKQSSEWEDGETLFLRSSIWRDPAQNVAETLQKGMRVIAEGRLKSRSYETKEGEKRTVIEFEIDEIGPSLRYAQAKVTRTQTGGGTGGGQGQQQGGQQGQWNGGGQQQGGGGNWGGQQGGQQQQGGGFGGQQGGFGGGQQQGGANWNQSAAQQQVAAQAQGQQQPQGQQQGGQAQQYAQAAANGPQQGAQQGGQDPWATPGVSNGGGWGNGPDSEPPF